MGRIHMMRQLIYYYIYFSRPRCNENQHFSILSYMIKSFTCCPTIYLQTSIMEDNGYSNHVSIVFELKNGKVTEGEQTEARLIYHIVSGISHLTTTLGPKTCSVKQCCFPSLTKSAHSAPCSNARNKESPRGIKICESWVARNTRQQEQQLKQHKVLTLSRAIK